MGIYVKQSGCCGKAKNWVFEKINPDFFNNLLYTVFDRFYVGWI